MGARMLAAAMAQAAFLAVVLFPSFAAAHTDLVGTDPREGSRLNVTPTTVTFVFNEAIRPELSTVVLSVGDRGDERRNALTLQQGETPSTLKAIVSPDALPVGDADTVWVATYRVTSQDGHAVEGALDFRAPARADLDADAATSSATPGELSPPTIPEPSGAPQPGPEAVDGSPSTVGTTASTLVIGGITLLGVALGCSLLIRARRRAFDS